MESVSGRSLLCKEALGCVRSIYDLLLFLSWLVLNVLSFER